MTRKSETPAMARRIMLSQGVVSCPLCGKRLKAKDTLIREHMVPLALDGADEEENMRYVHKLCADKKTTGRKHMSDGDSHLITKSKRLANGGKKRRGRELKSNSTVPPSRPIPKRHNPWGKKETDGKPA